MVFRKFEDQEKYFQHRARQNRRNFIKAKDNIDFNKFLAQVGVTQMGGFSNEMECDAID